MYLGWLSHDFLKILPPTLKLDQYQQTLFGIQIQIHVTKQVQVQIHIQIQIQILVQNFPTDWQPRSISKKLLGIQIQIQIQLTSCISHLYHHHMYFQNTHLKPCHKVRRKLVQDQTGIKWREPPPTKLMHLYRLKIHGQCVAQSMIRTFDLKPIFNTNCYCWS